MDLLFEAMLEDVRGKAWRHAFESTGYIDCQRWINQGVREHTFRGAFGPLPASMPSAQDMQYMSPQHKRMPYLQLMRPLEQRATGALSHTVAIKLFPISSRTRARAKRRAPKALPEPALASIARPCPGAASSSSSSSWMSAALKQEQQNLATEIKLEGKKRSRTLRNARRLTDEELVQVVVARGCSQLVQPLLDKTAADQLSLVIDCFVCATSTVIAVQRVQSHSCVHMGCGSVTEMQDIF